jgi:lipopolysaccharide export system permease protein
VRILSRNLASAVAGVFTVTLLALCLLFVMIDFLTRLLGDMVELGVPWPAVIRYYAALLPIAIVQYHLAGLSMLIAALAVVGARARRREVTAMLAAGIPLRRQAMPAFAVALAVAIAILAVAEWVMPSSERDRRIFEAEYLSRSAFEFSGAREPVSWSSLGGGWTCHITKFNRVALSGEEVFLLSLAEDHEEHIRARRIFWDRGRQAWMLEDGSWAVYEAQPGSQGASAMTEQRITQVRAPLVETPEELFEPFDAPAGFSTGELPRVIRTAEQRHVPVLPLRVEFHARFAGAALPLVMVLLAVPLGTRIRRGGRSAAVALAIGMGIVYFMLFNLSLNLGRIGRLDPALSAWFANLVFGLAGLELFRRAPT